MPKVLGRDRLPLEALIGGGQALDLRLGLTEFIDSHAVCRQATALGLRQRGVQHTDRDAQGCCRRVVCGVLGGRAQTFDEVCVSQFVGHGIASNL